MLLSDLLEARVVNESGDVLGRVHDVRARVLGRRRPDGHELRVLGLVIGGQGLRDRLGIDVRRHREPIADRDLIEWERVVAVDRDAGRVVVRDDRRVG
jgi:sporulation protein YlmC with PRC-barrel domain